MVDTVLGGSDKAEDSPEGQENTVVNKDAVAPEDKAVDKVEVKEGEENTEKPESEDGQADKDKPTGAPEKYEDFSVPEGMELDKALVDEFVPFAKEANLTQEQAQKLVDIYSKKQQAAVESQQEAWDKIREGWVKDFKGDKEIGGAREKETVATAKVALKEFGSPELIEALQISGLGDHPAVIRCLYKVGKAIGEDKVLTGNRTGGPVDRARTLYPDMT